MEKPLIKNSHIRIAMLGMVDGNGHPYSWSAIFNGYDKAEMAKCPFPGIPAYLNKQPKDTFGIADAHVTHVWTDDPADAVKVSKASLVPNVVAKAEDVIGEVDAVIVATDKGYEHVERCRPFVEAGLPIFVDKPMVDNEADLKTFCRWVEEGKPIHSSSSMRYCKEFIPYQISTHDLGELRYASILTTKTWERYGIHALESIYPIIGPGFVSVRNTGSSDRNILHLKHEKGVDATVVATYDLGIFGAMQLCGTKGYATAAISDSYYSFKAQLEAFVEYLMTGVRPFPFSETIELMKIVIAGIRSREEGGREVMLSEISDT
ncbi:MAG: Gfo/Idh/MocA family oxidoreductase [Armatimonadota bacterium]